MKTIPRTYEARGGVRGSCGHAHRTPEGAQRCANADARAIGRAYPPTAHARSYSDRVVCILAAGDGPDDVTDDEIEAASRVST